MQQLFIAGNSNKHFLLSSCHKKNDVVFKAPEPNTYSSEIATAWMDLQLRLMSTTTLPSVAFTRSYASIGIALYEAPSGITVVSFYGKIKNYSPFSLKILL